MNDRAYTSDTSRETEAVQLELIRCMQPSQRLAKALSLSCEMIRLSKAAIRRRHPEFSEDEVRIKFIEMHDGAELARSVKAWRAGNMESKRTTLSANLSGISSRTRHPRDTGKMCRRY